MKVIRKIISEGIEMASKGNNENTKTMSMDVILRFRLGDQCTLPSNIPSTLLKFHFRCFLRISFQ